MFPVKGPTEPKKGPYVPTGKARGCPPGGWPAKPARGCPPGGWANRPEGQAKKDPYVPTGKPRGRPPKNKVVENGGELD